MRRGTQLLLLALACAAAALPAALAQADDEFCAEAVEPGAAAAGGWEMLDAPELPEEALNATLAALAAAYTPFTSDLATSDLPPKEMWPPGCEGDALSVELDGCRQVPEDGAEAGQRFQLRLALNCSHTGHWDSALVEATLEEAADGAWSANITAADFALDDSHSTTPCKDVLCALCEQGKDKCDMCIDGAVQDAATGKCELPMAKDAPQPVPAPIPMPMVGAAAPDPTAVSSAPPDDAPAAFGAAPEPTSFGAPAGTPVAVVGGCGAGAFRNANTGLCAPCDRPGCLDCRACQLGDPLSSCVRGQFCLGKCTSTAFTDNQGGCWPCGNGIAGCAICNSNCDGRLATCHWVSPGVWMQCNGCAQGWQPAGDGTGTCRRVPPPSPRPAGR